MIFIPKRSIIQQRRSGPLFRRGICNSASHQALLSYGGAGGAAAYQVGAIDMTSPTYVRSAIFTGQVASKKFIFSAWVNTSGTSGDFWSGRDAGGTTYCNISLANIGANASVTVTFKDAGLTQLLVMTNSIGFSLNAWHHIGVAADLTVAGARMIMVDGVNDTSVTTFSNTANFAFDQCTNMGWGNNRLGSAKIAGCLAEMYFAMGQYLDLTVGANIAKFYASGHPVDLGATGSTPTGSAPSCLSHIATGTGVATDWATNRAGTGNWTPSGTPALCASSP